MKECIEILPLQAVFGHIITTYGVFLALIAFVEAVRTNAETLHRKNLGATERELKRVLLYTFARNNYHWLGFATTLAALGIGFSIAATVASIGDGADCSRCGSLCGSLESAATYCLFALAVAFIWPCLYTAIAASKLNRLPTSI